MGPYNSVLAGRGPPQNNGVISIQSGVGSFFYAYIHYDIPNNGRRAMLINRSREIGRVPQFPQNLVKYPNAFDCQVGFTRSRSDNTSSNTITVVTGAGTISVVITSVPQIRNNAKAVSKVEISGETDRIKPSVSQISATRQGAGTITEIFNINEFNLYVDILDNAKVTAWYFFRIYVSASKEDVYRAQVLTDVFVEPPVKAKAGNSTRAQASGVDLPMLFLLVVTDAIGGANLGSALFRVKQGNITKEWVRRPKLRLVVKGKGCTLNDKTHYLNGPTGDITDDLIEYGMTRYFLWFLVTGKWDICILRQSRTDEMVRQLERSVYVTWIPYIVNSEMLQYFIY